MNKLNDMSPFIWIRQGIEKTVDHSRVSNFLPRRYTYLCKIMHPFYRDLKIKDESLLWSNSDSSKEMDFELVEKLTFKDVARKYNLKYSKEINSWSFQHVLGSIPRYLILPDEGTMDKETLQETMNTLKPLASDTQILFQYDSLKVVTSFPDDPDYLGHLYTGKLDEVLQLYDKGQIVFGSPTYWWPEDKKWCIFTDFDFDFSIVGGTKEVIEEFLSNDKLECIEVDRDTRVDFEADKENQL